MLLKCVLISSIICFKMIGSSIFSYLTCFWKTGWLELVRRQWRSLVEENLPTFTPLFLFNHIFGDIQGPRKVQFLENHWKRSKIDFRKNDFVDPDRSQGYVFDLAEFKKRKKKFENFAGFRENDSPKLKISKKISFRPQKQPSHVSSL